MLKPTLIHISSSRISAVVAVLEEEVPSDISFPDRNNFLLCDLVKQRTVVAVLVGEERFLCFLLGVLVVVLIVFFNS
jgi:hypothetical protein